MIIVVGYGCSGYQPPAPVYGESTVTNPYENISAEKPNSTYQAKKNDQGKIQGKKTVSHSANIEHKTDLPIQKKKLSPAVVALVTEADKNARAGDLESAVVTIERALRIDSRNPTLTYKLALLRLKQSKPRLAEDLAKKASLLAANDLDLKRKSWHLISEARRRQKNFHGAKEAKIKADSL